jgi:DNA-binding NtrC family response regulator
VLIVEDDPDQLAVRSMLFTRQGLTSLSASGAQAALQLAAAERPHCALLDLRLPSEEAGLRLIRGLKGLDPAMKIVVLTGRTASLKAAPELAMVEAVFEKGSPTALRVDTILNLCR